MTISPDVSVSTNLGGWINKVGVFGPAEEPYYEAPEATRALLARLAVRPPRRARHLGDEPVSRARPARADPGALRRAALPDRDALRPVRRPRTRGVPLRRLLGLALRRARDAVRASRFHARAARTSRRSRPGSGWSCRACSTPSRRYAREVEWILLDQLRRMQEPEGESLYLRLSTKPVDQAPFAALVRAARGGGRASRRARGRPLAARGRAGRRLRGARHLRGDRARGSARRRAARGGRGRRRRRALRLVPRPALPRLAPQSPHASRRPDRDARASPTSSVCYRRRCAASRSSRSSTAPRTRWRSSAAVSGCGRVPLGVDRFGQCGSLPEVYEAYQLSPEAIATAALIALEPL